MRDTHRIGVLAAGAATLLAGLVAVTDAPAQDSPQNSPQNSPMSVLTDTQQYCVELSAEVEEERQALLSPAPAEVEALAQEGRHLCAMGEIRGGIDRLRRAVVLLHLASGHS
jgi:hypothetical protein